MATGFVYDPRYHDHDTGRGHPERPKRLSAIVQRLKDDGLWDRVRHLGPIEPAEQRWIETVHDRSYIARLKAVCQSGRPFIDAMDSAVCKASYDVALLAVGGVLLAVDAVMAGEVRNAFCAVRPPGHHCERDRSMGFCLLNNVAIAAEYLIQQHGLQRVAIVDTDVHHGNGTQHAFEDRADVLYVSVHEDPAYLFPGTGFAEETGVGAGDGFTLNIPLAPYADDGAYQSAFEQRVLPAIDRFEPQFVLVSVGYDMGEHDLLSHQQMTLAGLGWMTRQLKAAAERHCGGRLVSVLEGGYDLQTLGMGVAQDVAVMLEEQRS